MRQVSLTFEQREGQRDDSVIEGVSLSREPPEHLKCKVWRCVPLIFSLGRWHRENTWDALPS